MYLFSRQINLLLGGLFVLSLLFCFFLPERGILTSFSKRSKLSEKILIEDALKLLFDRKYRGLRSDITTTAGNLSISLNRATEVLDRLEKQGLVIISGCYIELSKSGISSALRLTRAHRILEKFFAEKTGFRSSEWHEKADIKEHTTPIKTIEELSVSLGNPVYDPHGDPIPTLEGKLPLHKGQILSTAQADRIYRVIRIEDRPTSIYEQIVALGIHPGMSLMIISAKKNKVIITYEGSVIALTQLFASSVVVDRGCDQDRICQREVLSDLENGERAKVTGISPLCRGQQRRRLMDMGIVKGGEVTAEIKSPSGDPTGYRIMGATIGIRKIQADLIYIEKLT